MKHCPLGAYAALRKESSTSRRIGNRFQVANIFLAIFLIAASGYALAAGDSLFQKVQNGILVKIGQAQVELAAVTPTAFCLSISYDGKPDPSPSIFLADPFRRVPVAWQLAQSGDFVGVKTLAGELLINPVTGQSIIKDASGRTLIPGSEIGKLSRDPNSSQSHVAVTVGWDKNGPPSFYGCGNGMGQVAGSILPTIIGVESLQQTNGQTHLGNGVAVIPYYWFSSVYSGFVFFC